MIKNKNAVMSPALLLLILVSGCKTFFPVTIGDNEDRYERLLELQHRIDAAELKQKQNEFVLENAQYDVSKLDGLLNGLLSEEEKKRGQLADLKKLTVETKNKIANLLMEEDRLTDLVSIMDVNYRALLAEGNDPKNLMDEGAKLAAEAVILKDSVLESGDAGVVSSSGKNMDELMKEIEKKNKEIDNRLSQILQKHNLQD